MARFNTFDTRRQRVRTSLRRRAGDRPRLSVHRSGRHIYVQVIDDAAGRTVAAASTLEKEARAKTGATIASAQEVGKKIAERAKAAGVTDGFTKVLEITGVGYRAAAQGRNLRLQLGYSHDVNVAVPEGLEVKTPDQTTIEISGNDRQRVGQLAAEIRRWRKPEPYKGKGIKYRGEYIFRKEGKKK